MQIADILGVLGILATVIFGVWGVVLVIKHRYPGRITLVRKSCIGLFDAIVKNLPELRVLYNDAPVGRGLVLLKGAFVNSGSKDVTAEMTEQRLTLNLPTSDRWLTARVVGNSPELRAKLEIQDNAMSVETGLFRKGECIQFEALAELSASSEERKNQSADMTEEFWRSLEVTHRIADTQAVEKVDVPEEDPSLLRDIVITGLVAIIIGASMWILSAHDKFGSISPDRMSWLQSKNGQTVYLIASTNGEFQEVNIKKLANGFVQTKGVKSNSEQMLSITNVFELRPGLALSEPPRGFLTMVILATSIMGFSVLGLLLVFLFLLFSFISRTRRERRLRKLLKAAKLSIQSS